MSEFKAGCSPITNKIYAGRVKKDKQGREIWQGQKHDITESAVTAVAQHLLIAEQEMHFTYYDGKRYVIRVTEITPVK